MSSLKKEMTVSCGIVVIRFDKGIPLFLLLRAYTYWDFCKGRPEVGESELDTALRETFEEANIPAEDLNFRWGKEFKESDVYKKGTKVCRYFVAESKSTNITLPVNPEIGKPEHNEYRWCSYDEAKKLTNERVGKILDWAMNKIGNN